VSYPPARRLDLVDDIHGRSVPDPYRWLEDPSTPETQAWMNGQDGLVRTWLDARAGRDHVRRRLRELLPGTVSAPAVRGRWAFFLRRQPEQEHAALLVQEGAEPPDGGGRVLIDPTALSPDATITLDAWQPSKEGDRLAYQLSSGGDEESELWVMDVAAGDVIEGPIDRCRYSPVAWLPGGDAYYYVRRLDPSLVPEGEASYHRRVYLHRVGADPDDDELVFGEGRDKTAFYDVAVSLDGRWLTLGEWLGTAPRNDLWIADLASANGHRALQTIHEGVDAETSARVGRDGRLYLHTTLDAPRWRLAVADPIQPDPSSWKDVVPESDGVLEGWCLTADAIATVHTHHAVASVDVIDKDSGDHRYSIPLPGLGVAGVTSRPEGGDDVWLTYGDFVTPQEVFHHRVSTGTQRTWATPPGVVELPDIITEQVTYASADGTEVRMFVICREGSVPDGGRAVVLNGYGGFNISMVPAYSSSIATWVESGGVYAVANLRGGGEEGEAWHRGGRREHKQHVFDDFIAAAERLVADGWTTPAHLGITGGSNGGLLVGAALTQRPDLFGAVVCSAPLLDMVRYEQFGLGQLWSDEYGSASVPDELDWLLSYSPYHHVAFGTAYPATLFTVFDSDTRVDPLHARKLCAALQWATSEPFDDAPILNRREKDAGHGARSVTRTIELSVDTSVFLADRLGLSWWPHQP
jgi:prolyl oligopeptidase